MFILYPAAQDGRLRDRKKYLNYCFLAVQHCGNGWHEPVKQDNRLSLFFCRPFNLDLCSLPLQRTTNWGQKQQENSLRDFVSVTKSSVRHDDLCNGDGGDTNWREKNLHQEIGHLFTEHTKSQYGITKGILI